jgi:predicted Zn-ribbon and HTH transcriptional regulator
VPAVCYAVLKETLRIDAERQEELKAILQLCRTEGEVEVPAVCYECGFEGKCLVVEGDDSDWRCLDCSCI